MAAKPIISVSALRAYLGCPRAFFFLRSRQTKRRTDYPRLMGAQVHRHIARLHKRVREARPFYYAQLNTALKSWWYFWEKALQEAIEARETLFPDEERATQYGRAGVACIANYWRGNVDRPHPVEVEKLCSVELSGRGVTFIGVLDQVREVSLEWIKAHRPELVKDGKLAEGYANQVIVDLKTDYLGYDPHQFREDPSLEEEIRRQYSLHEDLQATAYTYLFEMINGKKPIGFCWYHLRSGKVFFTYREERDYEELFLAIDHLIGNLNAQSFPKFSGHHCFRCDYLEVCREGRPFLISRPEDPVSLSPTSRMVPNLLVEPPGRQMRLKGLEVPRERQAEPPVVLPPRELLTWPIAQLPWADREATEVG